MFNLAQDTHPSALTTKIVGIGVTSSPFVVYVSSTSIGYNVWNFSALIYYDTTFGQERSRISLC